MTTIRQYTEDFEKLLKEEAEEAECMSILHTKCYEHFNWYSVCINIPVIIVSSIIGFISPLTLFNHQEIFLGALSICIGILKTVDSYFDITKRSETHRMTCQSYIRISRWIRLQLSLQKQYRIPASDMFDLVRKDLQHVRDFEPVIVKSAIDKFNRQFADNPEKQIAGAAARRPSILSETVRAVEVNNTPPKLEVVIQVAEASCESAKVVSDDIPRSSTPLGRKKAKTGSTMVHSSRF